MKFVLINVMILAWPLLCAENTKTLFMIEHNYQNTSTQVTPCKRQDHLKPVVGKEHNGSLVVHKNLNALVDTLINYFNTHMKKNSALVICDIDQTALTTKKNSTAHWSQKDFIPVDPILRLYKHLISHGYKIAFVTWRIDTPAYRAKTLQHLNGNGFEGFDSLHMRPKNWSTSCAEYKEHTRNKLAKEFTIVATLDDLWCNLCGANTGDCLIWVCDHPESPIKPMSNQDSLTCDKFAAVAQVTTAANLSKDSCA